MYKTKEYKKLTEEQTEKMLDGCKYREFFVRWANEYLEATAKAYTCLETAKEALNEIDLDDCIFQNNKQFTDLFGKLYSENRETFLDIAHHLERAEECFVLMVEGTGYSKEEAETLFHNCLPYGFIGS